MKALFTVATLLASSAFAWDSVCNKFPNKSLEASELEGQRGTPCAPSAGPATARERWVSSALDEHRRLWEMTRIKAGLPKEVSATRTITVFTGPARVDINGSMEPTLIPVRFEAAERVAYRSFSIGEFTHLPDFSWALWDWASGHEVCPLEGATSLNDCHDFAAHMGPVNSNHFVPQSREYYAHYHRLALARAEECRMLGLRLTGTGTRFSEFQRECELEALTFEAVGQHYLQDAWSMGHMWERWGSSSLMDFPGATIEEKRDRAVLTALVSGFFHGARGVLQALPDWTSFDVNDAMCAPWDGVRFKPGGGEGDITRGLGDDYLSVLQSDPTYQPQSTMFFQCSVSGLLEVYSAAGEAHGLASPEAGFLSVDPTSEKCFGQRATNQAIALGGAINLKIAGTQNSIPIDARFVSLMLPKVARASGKVAVAPKMRNEFRFQLQRSVTVARLRAKDDPLGTSLASGDWGTFMGAKPNGQYSGIASYIDAEWPWVENEDRTQYVKRTFHRAHATEFCESTTVANIELLRSRAQDLALSADDRAAACTACTEVAIRHLRIGTGPGSYDTTQQPLCEYLTPSSARVYHQVSGVTDPLGTAIRYCCP
jgi:hypothetical protein